MRSLILGFVATFLVGFLAGYFLGLVQGGLQYAKWQQQVEQIERGVR